MTDWNPALYQAKHAFVWQGGAGILDWLAPEGGERIVDLGCGTGELTAKIAQSGARVLGLDASPEMVAGAEKQFPTLEFRVADATTFELAEQANAVFSNAALHWVRDAESAAERIASALKPGGRLVAELGGRGNVEGIVRAVRRARTAFGLAPFENPWYFPSLGEYAGVLEGAGLRPLRMELFARPTKLDGEDGLSAWLEMFGAGLLHGLTPEQRATVVKKAAELARPALYRDGEWWADYVRLRVLALKPDRAERAP